MLEPMGVHREHRGHGYGKAITVAAAAALQELGSSSAIVCTPSSNVGAVATYKSAGFEQLPETRDLLRGSRRLLQSRSTSSSGAGSPRASTSRTSCTGRQRSCSVVISEISIRKNIVS